MQLKPDQLIDNRYKIISKLGQGGMGAVWKATDTKLGDEVVLKLPLAVHDEQILKRFGQEALTMRKYSGDCPFILDIQDVGDIDGVPFYVMRYQAGGALRDRIDASGAGDGATNQHWTLKSFGWLPKIAEALDFLHTKKCFHRDVKPENILFSSEGAPFLVDFGIVKELDTNLTQMTATGMSIGTCGYMAPEVLRDAPFSAQADQYALAVTVYEAITGERPYEGSSLFALYDAFQKGHRNLTDLSGQIPTVASLAVDRALSGEPEQRFETCDDFSTAFLDGLIASDQTPQGVESEQATSELNLEKYKRQRQQAADKSSSVVGGLDFIPAGRSDANLVPGTPVESGNKSNSGLKFALLSLVVLLLVGGAIFGVISTLNPGERAAVSGGRNPSVAADLEQARLEKESELKREQLAELEREREAKAAKQARLDEASKLKREQLAELEREREAEATKQARLKREAEAAQREQRRLAEAKPKPEVSNKIGMQFRLIPAGTFMMGSPADEPNRGNDELQHEVVISNDFYLGVTEVTQGQWTSVMGTEPWKGEVKEGKNFAASCVSWDDAVEFCEKLSAQDGVKYRLPTEAEWEYACRGGSKSTFGFGNNSSDLGKYAWFDGNANSIGEKYAHEVGLKLGNGFRLHDMHGNVWEWCSDGYGSDYYGASPRTDPQGPEGGAYRVSRGGSWGFSARRCRSANRNGNSPGIRFSYLGFRVLRSSIK